jgi:hypothetical protein
VDIVIRKSLNNLYLDVNKQLEKLVEYYKAGRITLDDIINYKAIGLTLAASALNYFSVKVFSGTDGITANQENAGKIWIVASDLGSYWAKWNLVNNNLCRDRSSYLYLLDEIYKNINKLKSDEATFKKEEHKIIFYAARGYFENKKYSEAWNAFLKVPEKVDSQDNPEYQQAQRYLEAIKKIAQGQLNGMFHKATPVSQSVKEAEVKVASPAVVAGATAVDNTTAGIAMLSATTATTATTSLSTSSNVPNDSTKMIVSRYSLFEGLDAYDPYELQAVIIAFKKAELEFDIARDAHSKAKDALDNSKQALDPKFLIDAFIEVEKQKLQQMNEIEKSYNAAKTKYDEAMSIATTKEVRRQVQTEKHFFAIERNKNPLSHGSALHILQQRQREKNDVKTIPLVATGVTVRSLIAAEHAVIRASLQIFGMPRGYNSAAFPWTLKSIEKYRTDYSVSDQLYGHWEAVQLADVVITYHHRIDPHENHVGDFYMNDLGTYSGIYNFLEGLAWEGNGIKFEKEQQLAKWMLRYTKTGQPITLDELKTIQDNTDVEEVKRLMRIFYHCFVKEPASWMIPRDEANELPLATVQLRAVKLITQGFLHLKDVFGKDSDYGVFTGKDIGSNIAKLHEKVHRINKLYIENVLLSKGANRGGYFDFKRQHPEADAVTTRSELHQELIDDFGGGDDTDGEGYDSDTAEQLYPSTYKF